MSILPTVKFLIIGNAGVGKTNIMERYTVGQFYDNWISTVGIDFRSKILTIKEQQVKIQIWDTAGQERYRTIVASYYRGAHAIILVYDVTDRSSFSDVQNWLEQIRMNADSGIEITIVGNKIDLVDQRVISYEQGKTFADTNQLKFYEVSAKTNINIEETFLNSTESVLNNPNYQKKLNKTVLNLNRTSNPPGSSGCCGKK